MRSALICDVSNGNCVEVAGTGTMITVRDSQDQDGPQLAFALEQWAAFAALVKATHQNPGRSRPFRSGPRP